MKLGKVVNVKCGDLSTNLAGLYHKNTFKERIQIVELMRRSNQLM